MDNYIIITIIIIIIFVFSCDKSFNSLIIDNYEIVIILAIFIAINDINYIYILIILIFLLLINRNIRDYIITKYYNRFS